MSPQSKHRNRWRWWFGVGLLIAVAGGVFASRSGAGTKDSDSPLEHTVKRGDLAIDVLETGKIKPREMVEVKSKVAGQVSEVAVLEGAQVKKGDLLLQLDPTDVRREVARMEADVAQAKNALEFAELNLSRRERGMQERAVAEADVDLARSEKKMKTVALQSAQVGLAAAQDRLRYTRIVSPLNGTVIARGIQPGEVVTPGVQATFEGKPLLTVADLSTLIVKADLNQIDIAKVKLGQEVTLTLDALPGKKYKAKVTQVAPASILPKGKEVEVFPIEATLVTADAEVKPGMTADVRVHVETKPQVLSLPIEAILKESGKSYVTKKLVVGTKTKEEKVEVKVGARNDREVEVQSGVTEGERILIRPASSAANEVKM